MKRSSKGLYGDYAELDSLSKKAGKSYSRELSNENDNLSDRVGFYMRDNNTSSQVMSNVQYKMPKLGSNKYYKSSIENNDNMADNSYHTVESLWIKTEELNKKIELLNTNLRILNNNLNTLKEKLLSSNKSTFNKLVEDNTIIQNTRKTILSNLKNDLPHGNNNDINYILKQAKARNDAMKSKNRQFQSEKLSTKDKVELRNSGNDSNNPYYKLRKQIIKDKTNTYNSYHDEVYRKKESLIKESADNLLMMKNSKQR